MIKQRLQFLIWHCLATPKGFEVSSDEVRKWHLSKPPVGRGWAQVGYSDIIHLDGRIENMVEYNEDDWVDPWEITNGALGMNYKSRHVAYVGGIDLASKPKDTTTPAQVRSMKWYVGDMIAKHPDIIIGGHNQFDNKACPSFNVPKWLRSFGIQEKNICQLKVNL